MEVPSEEANPFNPCAPAPGSESDESHTLLAQREAALQRREAELNSKEEQLRVTQKSIPEKFRTKNWPVCYPVTYHSIKDEIPESGKTIVKTGYFLWFVTISALVLNFVSCTVLWLSHEKGEPTFNTPGVFLWSLLYMCLGIPGSWKLWYRSMYTAIAEDRALSFLWFFVMFLGHTVFCFVAAVGVPSTSTTGVLVMITVWTWRDEATGKHYYGEAGLCMITSILWVVAAAVSLWLLRTMHATYKTRGSAGATEVKKKVVAGATQEAAGLFSGSLAATLSGGVLGGGAKTPSSFSGGAVGNNNV